jgi:hypothetical protein
MKGYCFKEKVVEFFKRAYEFVSTDYRLARFDEMEASGELEWMCSSQIHKRFGVCGFSKEI